MRVFIPLRRISVLFLMLLAMPGTLPGAVSAQDASLCDRALEVVPDVGNVLEGYEVVTGSGGSGSQIVVGTDGPDALSGGSGNDVLCGYAGADTLEGGSGNDILVGGVGIDALYAGSGNDTLVGTSDETLDEGSGKDEIVMVVEMSACDLAKTYDKDMNRVSLAGLDLTNCDLSGRELSGANLSGANLIGANLIGAELDGVNLTNANLTDADLTSADLGIADLTGATLDGATLTDVQWQSATCPDGAPSLGPDDGCDGHLQPIN